MATAVVVSPWRSVTSSENQQGIAREQAAQFNRIQPRELRLEEHPEVVELVRKAASLHSVNSEPSVLFDKGPACCLTRGIFRKSPKACIPSAIAKPTHILLVLVLTSEVGRAANDVGNLVIDFDRCPMGTLNFLFGFSLSLFLNNGVKITLICELGTLNMAPLTIQTTSSPPPASSWWSSSSMTSCGRLNDVCGIRTAPRRGRKMTSVGFEPRLAAAVK